MGTPRVRTKPSLDVTIVASNPETLDGLQSYLRGAGAGAHGMSELAGPELVPSETRAVVFFPDDFVHRDVIDTLARFRRERPSTVLVVVTSDPKRFRALASSMRTPPVVLPKPAWGWKILEAIRGKALR